MGPAREVRLVLSLQHPVSRGETGGSPEPGSQSPVCSKANSALQARAISKELTHNWPKIKDEMEFLGRHLTKWNLVKAITILSEARKSRFLRSRRPKYGSMNKGFTDEELERFFGVIKDPKAHLLFSFQAILGLRIGEAVRLNIKDINLKTRELRIFTEKSGKTDYLLIPEKLFDTTLQYIGAYEKEIATSKGYLFFSFTDGRRSKATQPFITTHTARCIFREYVKTAKLEEVYGYSRASNPKPLFRLSPHSLRHYAITNFSKKNAGNVILASRFARHSNIQVTMTYIHTKREELYASIERANDDKLLRRAEKIQAKL